MAEENVEEVDAGESTLTTTTKSLFAIHGPFSSLIQTGCWSISLRPERIRHDHTAAVSNALVNPKGIFHVTLI
jgi:hypothetical protein